VATTKIIAKKGIKLAPKPAAVKENRAAKKNALSFAKQMAPAKKKAKAARRLVKKKPTKQR
jgi:hypothetical protein